MNKPAMREGFQSGDPVDDDKTIDGTASNVPVDQPIPQETWPVSVRLLHKEIRDNKGVMQTELHFREPTARDIAMAGGNPCKVNGDLTIEINDARMMTIMANLSGIMEPFLQTMDPRDYNSCAYRLRNFFLPEAAAWM